jgi:uncharacterized phosphosugar-binding protein
MDRLPLQGKKRGHSSGHTILTCDIVVDTCSAGRCVVPLKNHEDKIGPVSTMAFVTTVWMTVTTVAEILANRGVKLFIHPSTTYPAMKEQRLD